MEVIYLTGEGLCRTEDKTNKCRTVPRNAGRMATLAQWRCKSIRVSTYFLKLFYFFDFLVTGGTYMTTKLGPKRSKKNKKKTESKFFVCPSIKLSSYRDIQW